MDSWPTYAEMEERYKKYGSLPTFSYAALLCLDDSALEEVCSETYRFARKLFADLVESCGGTRSVAFSAWGRLYGFSMEVWSQASALKNHRLWSADNERVFDALMFLYLKIRQLVLFSGSPVDTGYLIMSKRKKLIEDTRELQERPWGRDVIGRQDKGASNA